MAEILNGTVEWFNNAKGFGFIKREDGGEDVFVHYTAIAGKNYRTLKADEPVTFYIVEGPKGPQAAGVISEMKVPVRS